MNPNNSPEKFDGKLYGFRSWRLTHNPEELESLFASRKPWTPGENIAECNGIHEETVPAKKCGCGWNAWNSIPYALAYESSIEWSRVFGAIAGYGKIQIHRDGWRAEKAKY